MQNQQQKKEDFRYYDGMKIGYRLLLLLFTIFGSCARLELLEKGSESEGSSKVKGDENLMDFF
jgi:hypothetical protein